MSHVFMCFYPLLKLGLEQLACFSFLLFILWRSFHNQALEEANYYIHNQDNEAVYKGNGI